jgi:hypothetical protein
MGTDSGLRKSLCLEPWALTLLAGPFQLLVATSCPWVVAISPTLCLLFVTKILLCLCLCVPSPLVELHPLDLGTTLIPWDFILTSHISKDLAAK